MIKMNSIKKISFLLIIVITSSVSSQCFNDANVYTFEFNAKTYQVIKEKKTWVDAANCAVEKGGYLAEINNSSEQDAIFNELINNANMVISETVAPDGGGASYVWIGANDKNVEGEWKWDGNNDGNGVDFWLGNSLFGFPVNGLYNNWGNEPDDFNNNQDAMGIALTDWPRGVLGEWNDVDEANQLYFLIEYNSVLKVGVFELKKGIRVINEILNNEILIKSNNYSITKIELITLTGQKVLSSKIISKKEVKINMKTMHSGMYILNLYLENGMKVNYKIIN